MTSALLGVRALVSGYGQVRTLHGVDLAVREGEITAVLGSNGAGKSTLMRCLAGLLPVEAGAIELAGERIDRLDSDQRVARGIVLVPEGRLVFARMSVEENLRVGAFVPAARAVWRDSLAEVYRLYPRLAERRRQAAGSLSGGEQQMLAIGRGLMARPRVLLLDEPTLGLAPKAAGEVFEVMAELARQGITILVAEQDVRRTLARAAAAYVLEHGRVALSGSGPELLERPEIRQAYLGI